jgi:hypothetical protein
VLTCYECSVRGLGARLGGLAGSIKAMQENSALCAPKHKAHTSLICMRDMKRAGGVWGTQT